jgi:uracil-DNA glycosylase
LALTPLSIVRVVILGQDPYHGPGQAHGLAFSVADRVPPPPSLRNIFKEISRDGASNSLVDFALQRGVSGSLERWASQGVLLLNTCLTVEHGLPASHAKQGWESLTDAIIQAVWANPNPTVFMLWGAHAQTKQALMTAKLTSHNLNHLVLTANHPSPLSALRPPKPFIGCGHFGQANAFLNHHGGETINW